MVTGIVVAAIATVALVLIARALRVVPRDRAAVVERGGRYHRTLSPGFAVLLPFVDRVRSTVDLREQVVSIPARPVPAGDGRTVNVATVVRYRVSDPGTASYVPGVAEEIVRLTGAGLGEVVGSVDSADVRDAPDRIGTYLRSVLDSSTATWGVRVAHVELNADGQRETADR